MSEFFFSSFARVHCFFSIVHSLPARFINRRFVRVLIWDEGFAWRACVSRLERAHHMLKDRRSWSSWPSPFALLISSAEAAREDTTWRQAFEHPLTERVFQIDNRISVLAKSAAVDSDILCRAMRARTSRSFPLGRSLLFWVTAAAVCVWSTECLQKFLSSFAFWYSWHCAP